MTADGTAIGAGILGLYGRALRLKFLDLLEVATTALPLLLFVLFLLSRRESFENLELTLCSESLLLLAVLRSSLGLILRTILLYFDW